MTTRSATTASAVGKAIEEIRATFHDKPVQVRPDGEGGAFVTVDGVDPGAIYKQRDTWIGFRITFQYPYADVYPHYIRADLSRKDGKPLGDGTSPAKFEGREAIQLSRRSNRLNPAIDTAVLKLQKVLEWLRSRP